MQAQTVATVLQITQQALSLILWLSLPAILTSAVVGLIVSLIQAVTQVQDQSIAQSAKMIAVLLVLLGTAAWMGSTVVNFAESTMALIATL